MFIKLLVFIFISNSNARLSTIHYGCWQLESVKWQNKLRPPFNPNLQLYFIFYKNNTLRVYWNFKNDKNTFCERVSRYSFYDDILEETVLWLNPNNAPECSKDPDMHVGRYMTTALSVIQQKLVLHLKFSGDSLDYIFNKCEELP